MRNILVLKACCLSRLMKPFMKSLMKIFKDMNTNIKHSFHRLLYPLWELFLLFGYHHEVSCAQISRSPGNRVWISIGYRKVHNATKKNSCPQSIYWLWSYYWREKNILLIIIFLCDHSELLRWLNMRNFCSKRLFYYSSYKSSIGIGMRCLLVRRVSITGFARSIDGWRIIDALFWSLYPPDDGK